MSLELKVWKEWFSVHREEIFHDFFEFLKFKTIATDSNFAQETKNCAQWLSSYLQKIGLNSEIWETSGMPVVFASYDAKTKNAPTLLVYHHYDVQPVDPLHLWHSDPFDPVVREGKVFARGAQDNKGQCFYTMSAIKALLELATELRFNLRVFIEGEEESGSVGTHEVLLRRKKELKSDYLLVVDSGLPKPNVPAITLGARGIMTLEVTCRSANNDMHSGMMGGIAYNPIRALVTALSKLWTPEGRVAIPQFYEDVAELTSDEKKLFDLEMDEAKMKKDFGLKNICPEPGFSIGESSTIRPTLEINGISGGYSGEGFKTVIPAIASAKISSRLVPNQNPDSILAHFKSFLKSQFPKNLEVNIECSQKSPAFRSHQNSLIAKLAVKAYEEVLGKHCKNILIGGSIPITVELSRASGAETVLMGYGLDSDQIHAPNEHFGLDRFEQGFLTMGRIFAELHEQT